MVYLNYSKNTISSGKPTPVCVAQKGEFFMTYLGNAFSLNMIPVENFTLIRARKVTPADVPQSAISVIGHADTAKIVSGILNYEVPANRVNVTLESGDVLYVAQYKGPRLPEGATQLPEGATLEFIEITFIPEGCKGCPGVDCNLCGTICWTHGN